MRKGQECYGDMSVETAIAKAKDKIIKAYEGENGKDDRPWLIASADSYKSEHYRISIIVREGSPAKGYIIVNYGFGTVIAYDAQDNLLFKWTGLAGRCP
jgi:hypothetical protein